MNTHHGHCLCGKIAFCCEAESLRAYQCHCSICRQASGSAFTTTLMVPQDGFCWQRGADAVASYTNPQGYTVNFCAPPTI